MIAGPDRSFHRALTLSIIVPAMLWAGAAIGAQRIFGLFPCEMCLWQRWPHLAALALGLLAFLVRERPLARPLVALAGLAILVSGLIGVYHAGVEYHWWQGLNSCSAPAMGGSGDLMKDIMNAPLVRCDVAAWSFAGISLAGFNALFSLLTAAAIFTLLARRRSRL